ncbi:MAG: cell division protein FtsA [Gammaproteobacteria bacterium]
MKNGEETANGVPTAAVDFGGATVRVLAAEMLPNRAIRLVGVGEAASAGVDEGRVINMEEASASLQNALREAELMSRRKITSAWAAVTGAHIAGIDASGTTVVDDPEGVSPGDIKEVKRQAEAEAENHNGKKVIATLERYYELGGHKGVQRPLGMSGSKLSGGMHLVLASVNALADWEKCLLQSGVETESQFTFSALAAAPAVLTEDEKQLGVCIADIGASTTDVAVFHRGAVAGVFSFSMASDDIHRDIAEVHHASLESAERAKKTIGLAGDSGEFVSLLEAGGGGESRQSLAVVRDTIAHRADEILETIGRRLDEIGGGENRDGRRLAAGIVLVGDGALLPGLAAAASAKLGMPARVGRPLYRGENHESISSPRFAVAAGLLQTAAARREERRAARSGGLRTACRNFLARVFGGRPPESE